MTGFSASVIGVIFLLVLSSCMGNGSDIDTGPTEAAQPGLTSAPLVESIVPAATANIAATALAANCPVTAPSDQVPWGWIGETSYPVWYQKAGLWVGPVSQPSGNPSLPEDSGEWFAGGTAVTILPPTETRYPAVQGSASTILLPNPDEVVEISGRLVTDTPTDESDDVMFKILGAHPNYGVYGDLVIPTTGCWELEISAGDQTFALTVYVLPFEERADVASALQTREAILTSVYPVPTPCIETELTLDTSEGMVRHRLKGDGIDAVFDPSAIFWAYELTPVAVYPKVADGFELTGQLQDDPSIILRTSIERRTGVLEGDHWTGTLVFPAPGCWELSGSTDGDTFEATFYVYPPECRREPDEAVPEDCQPPGT